MLEIKKLSKRYDDIIIDNLSICFPSTGMVVIVGKSGCGKTNKSDILNIRLLILKISIIVNKTCEIPIAITPIIIPINIASLANKLFALLNNKPLDNIKHRSLFLSIKIVFKIIEIKINEIPKLIIKKQTATIIAISIKVR